MTAAKPRRKGGLLKGLRWLVVIVGVGLLGWRMIAANLSQQLVREGSEGSVKTALAWAPNNPRALYARAVHLIDTDPEQAEKLLRQAIELAPTTGRMFSRLGLLLERRGEVERAEQAMSMADQLAPRNSVVQADLAEYWGRRNRPEEYLRHLVAVVDLNADYFERAHPAMLSVVDNPRYASLVRKVLSEAIRDRTTDWWSSFFGYASWKAENLDTVRLLFSIRRASYQGRSPLGWEFDQFMARLQRDGKWVEAYFLWLNSLSDDYVAVLGNVFNGGFSRPLSNEGFGWRFSDHDGVSAKVAETEDGEGGRALRLQFSGRRGQRVHVEQYLMLPPGGYEFSGRVRTVAIDESQGLRWQLHCVAPESAEITETALFSGTEPWRGFSKQLDIPAEGCEIQQLQLAQAGGVEDGRMTRGTAWFDDLVLRSLD